MGPVLQIITTYRFGFLCSETNVGNVIMARFVYFWPTAGSKQRLNKFFSQNGHSKMLVLVIAD